MTQLDYRKLLKDTIRGTICDFDIPAVPIAIDECGEAVGSSREELELFSNSWTVMAEHLDSRPSIARQIAKLREECLGCSSPAAAESHKTFQLLDRDGAPAKDPESVVTLELRDADGNV
jgi:hypothetical protein